MLSHPDLVHLDMMVHLFLIEKSVRKSNIDIAKSKQYRVIGMEIAALS